MAMQGMIETGAANVLRRNNMNNDSDEYDVK